jgi:hypothetical protein
MRYTASAESIILPKPDFLIDESFPTTLQLRSGRPNPSPEVNVMGPVTYAQSCAQQHDVCLLKFLKGVNTLRFAVLAEP